MPTPPAKTPRFFIALLPPKPIWDYAEAVICELGDRYNTRTAKAPPHVTLQPPFLWAMERVAPLEAAIAQVAQEYAAVPVLLRGFGAFAPRVLYLNVLKTPELLTLQGDLMLHLQRTLGIVDPTTQRRPFAPHMTVASRNMSSAIFRQAWADLQTRDVAFDFVSDRLTLLVHHGHRWEIYAHYPLRSPIAPS
ncbi:2'-5' RNA ligase family protein [Leptolyngbya sp. AN02str]|uniref:2'-5' RNA ligase family protein n=1 Tax=Leptolyngbya sp. AN02str TaxID=3423363 RepID=UPI003D31E74B